MRILLDEGVPVALRYDVEATAETVTYRSWDGLSNGDLLRAAEAEYDVLVTLDTNVAHQQNLARFDIAVVVLRAYSDDVEDLRALMPQVNAALTDAVPRQLLEVFLPEKAERRRAFCRLFAHAARRAESRPTAARFPW